MTTTSRTSRTTRTRTTARDRQIARIPQESLTVLVDAIERVMNTHSEPYRTMAEALILSRGPGAAEWMAEAIHAAVDEDCGPRAGR